jgi:metallo-beta-lactamase class B
VAGPKGFHPLGSYKPVKVDRILKDGDMVSLGNTTLTAHLTPGHTEGNTTWTTTVEESGRKYNVVFAGSMSINPGVRMINNPTWPGILEAYAGSFAKLKSLPCDVFLGPHAPFLRHGGQGHEDRLRKSFCRPGGFSEIHRDV